MSRLDSDASANSHQIPSRIKLGNLLQSIFSAIRIVFRPIFEQKMQQRNMRMKSLVSYLRTPRPGFAFAIVAKWGAGKSYFWENHGDQHLPKDMSQIRVSCAGLSTLEDLERALLSASISVPGPVKELGTVLGRALLRIAQIDPNDVKLTPEVRSQKHVVVLDDVERFGGECKVLFGFAINLLDASGVHVVLLVDENQAAQVWPETYLLYRERVIGSSSPLSSDVAAFARSTVTGFASLPHRQMLVDILPTLLDRFSAAEITNLRTVRVVCERLKDVLQTLDFANPPERLQHLLLATTFWTLVSREDHGSLSAVRRLFERGDFSMTLAMHEAKSARGDGPTQGGDLTIAIAALKKFKMWEDCFGWKASPSFVRLMDGIDVDAGTISDEFDLDRRDSSRDPLERIARALENSDDELRADIASLLSEFERHEVASISRMQRIIETLFYLCSLGLTAVDEAGLSECFVRLVEAYPANRLQDFEPYPFLEPSEVQPLLRVRASVQDLQKRAELAFVEGEGRAARAFWYRGEGEPPSRNHLLLFPEAETDQNLRDMLDATDASATLRILSVLRERLSISNARDFLSEDRPGALKIADAVSKIVQPATRPVTVKFAALRVLERMIRRYAEHVRKDPPQVADVASATD